VVSHSEGSKRLGALEGEVMRMVWAADEPQTVRAVLEELNRHRRPQLAYTTVMTVMGRLAEKGVLRRARTGRQYVYEPAVADEAAIAVGEVVRDFGEAAVAPFVEAARSDPMLRRRLQRLMKDHT
jgi:predicted transcriptional regulator